MEYGLKGISKEPVKSVIICGAILVLVAPSSRLVTGSFTSPQKHNKIQFSLLSPIVNLSIYVKTAVKFGMSSPEELIYSWPLN